MATESWYAWLALRRRVSMSAIGSVMVIVCVLSRSGFGSLCRFSGRRPTCYVLGCPEIEVRAKRASKGASKSPARLGHAGKLPAVGHLPQADPAQAELAVDGLG